MGEEKDEEGKELKEGEEEAAKVKPSHRLLIKSAILMPTAKKDEVTVIEIESEGYKNQKINVPICAMKGGVDLQKYVDLLVPGPSKIKIIHGEGPVHLVGSHCVDFFGFKDDEESDDEEDEEEGDTENEMEVGDEETAKGSKSGDKKESGDKKSTPEKSEKKSTPVKEDKKTPNKDEKKRKNSADSKSAEKKAKN